MSETWETKDGLRRVRRDPPTVEEAVQAAQDLSDELTAQIEIVASLMDLSTDEARGAVLRPSTSTRRKPMSGSGGSAKRAPTSCRPSGSAAALRVGTLTTRRDFTDVRDVAVAYRLLMEAGAPGEVYNVCSGADVAMSDVAAQLLALAGADLTLETDPALVRHLHDLQALREHYEPAAVAALAREVMLAEAEAYGNQFPAYREEPLVETLRAVEGLATDPSYASRYEEFQRLMVYGARVDYGVCIATLRELAERISGR